MDPFASGTPSNPSQEPAQDGMVWWFKWLIKGASVVLGFLAVVLGIVTALSISLKCIIGGIILM